MQISAHKALRPLALVPLFAAALVADRAEAACDIFYDVQPGDTYYSIASAEYGSRAHWSEIFNANRTADGQPALAVGKTLYIPCIPGLDITDVTPTAGIVQAPTPSANVATAPVEQPVSVAPPREKWTREYPDNPEMTLLTGGDYAPFTDQYLPQGGMVTELLHAALDMTPSPVTYSVTWEDDWSQHLFPLLDEKSFDMGFPWLKPDCDTTPDNERCANFHFSEPLMLMPIMLFARSDNQFKFEEDEDILGRSICRPKGYFTHDLDSQDRRWISDGKIDFVVGENPRDCFQKVSDGVVDAATVNLFLGANVILEMGLRNQIVPLEKPVSEQGLHVVISKRHWRGTTHLYRINAGIEVLRNEGKYQEIVSKHMENFRTQLN